MVVPTGSSYPDILDDDTNLFEVHDSLRLRLTEDYNPGDTSITVQGDLLILSRMPPTGIVTLTEQCSDPKERAISFHYTDVEFTTGFEQSDIGTISGLELLEEFPDLVKPKTITNVTVSVMARHHNQIKDAVIAVQEFAGVKGTTDKEPLGSTLEGRINFLRNLVLVPKAWFSANKRSGNVPLEIEFTERAFRLATDTTEIPVKITFDFGDGDIVEREIDEEDPDTNKFIKTYLQSGIFTVKMSVENSFGSDEVIFEDFVNARVKAPGEAIVRFIENSEVQDVTPGVPPDGRAIEDRPPTFDVFPKIRSPINTLIELEIPRQENPATPDFSFGGEPLDGLGNPIDPIVNINWAIGDDLEHANSPVTKVSFGVGGIFDFKLRVDTELGAFRITTYEDSFDIVEKQNLWMWIFEEDGFTARSFEFGLISESFKVGAAATHFVDRNSSFLDNVPESENQKREFNRNVGFAPRGTRNSGSGGNVLLYWAGGRNELDPVASEEIRVVEFNGFNGTYITRDSISRPWNWANINSTDTSFFVFGRTESEIALPNTSPTNSEALEFELTGLSTTTRDLIADNFLNGADELLSNVSIFDGLGNSIFGDFSVTRTAFKDNTGFIARNAGVGPTFRISSFYRTEGIIGSPFRDFRKMQDIQVPIKVEGNITDLSSGIYFLNNSGAVSRFENIGATWSIGGPGVNSVLYRNLQDTSVVGFDDQANTLLLASDSDRRAYLSFDYSPNAFVKFNEVGLVFSGLVPRPEGEQFIMGIY